MGGDVLAPGVVIDRYEVVEPLGEGGMAAVWKVRHRLLGSLHALKVLRPELVVLDDVRERFLGEGRIQAQLCHPHIAVVTDIVADVGIAGLVLEFVPGETLESRLARGPLSAGDVAAVFLPVLEAIAHAHEHGVVHRDLKPSNVLLQPLRRGRVRPVILDFGVARVVSTARLTVHGGARANRTEAGARIGTVRYMSPEQLHDASEVTPASDTFTLGVMLAEAVTGRHPFVPPEEASDFEVMKRIEAGQVADVSAGLPDALRPLGPVLHRALSPTLAPRFPDAAAMLEAVEAALRGTLDPRGPWSAPAPLPPQPRSAPAPAPAPAPAVAAVPGPAALVDRDGRAHALVPPRMLVGALRGNVEPLTGRPPFYSHAVIERTGAGWTLWESSRLPVLVDGAPLKGVRFLRGGEQIEVNGFGFRFEPGR